MMAYSKEIRQSYLLADDSEISHKALGRPAASFWYDCRGADISGKPINCYDISNNGSDAETGMIRELTETFEGVITCSVVFTADTCDGMFLRLYDRQKHDVVYLYCENGRYYTENQVYVGAFGEEAIKRIDLVIDFDNSSVTYIIGESVITLKEADLSPFCFIKIGTLPKSRIKLNIKHIYMHANFIANDLFKDFNEGEIPYLYKGECKAENANLAVYGNASRGIEKASGHLCFEAMIYTDKASDGCEIALNSAGNNAFRLSKINSVFCAGSEVLKEAQDEMWYRLRLEIDTVHKNVVVKINGKKVGEVNLICDTDYIDSISFTAEGCKMLVDRVKLYYLIDYDDYCPMPVLPKKKDGHIVGINVCSLWHSRYHIGWDCISPYDEIKPVLGFYDEGIPEVADWEIKMLAENGVDFQMFCWYASNANGPMKDTMHSYALHDGYMNAKYSDICKFAILWEAANGVHLKNSEAFRKYIVPYFVEHFFSDNRYMTIDNKAIMAVFGAKQLICDFGSADKVKTELDYLRNEVKKLGYDDLIILNCGFSSAEIAECGYDGSYQYGWGKQGCEADFTISAIKAQKETDKMNTVPTVSTGFNNVGWACTRSKNITASDFEKVNIAVRDEILPSFANQPSWSKKLVMLSNWNEYGEGTYIMPCEKLCGFGYLEAVKKVYCDEFTDTNIVPTENQKSRLGYLYSKNRKALQMNGCYKVPAPDNVVASYNFGNDNIDILYELDDVTASLDNGTLRGKTHGGDPSLVVKNGIKVDLSGVTHLRLRGKTTLPVHAEFFYLTEGQTEFTQRNAVNVAMFPECSYGVSVISGKLPDNTVITGLRFDPANIAGVEFEYHGIDLLSAPELIYRITVDGYTENMSLPFKEDDGEVFIPFNPKQDYVYRLGFYYEYYSDEGKLCLISNNNELVLFINKNKALLNGESVVLKKDIELFDGIPLLPLGLLSDVFGFEYKTEMSHLIIDRV